MAADQVDMTNCVVRLDGHNVEGGVLGAGVLIDRRHVVGCSHSARKGSDRRRTRRKVRVHFPLIPGSNPIEGLVLISRIDSERDLLVIRLTSDSPDEAATVRWSDCDSSSWGTECSAFGFPVGREDGVWAHLTLRGAQGNGWVQVDSKLEGYAVAIGFSGTPVWDSDRRKAIGLIVAVDTPTRAAFMIPANTVKEYVDRVQTTHNLDELATRLSSDMAESMSDTDRARGSAHWNVRVLQADALTNVLNDLAAFEGQGLPPDASHGLTSALSVIANYASGVGDAARRDGTILSDIEGFIELIGEWIAVEGEGSEALLLRRSKLKELRRSRHKIAQRTSKSDPNSSAHLLGFVAQTYETLKSLCEKYPGAFKFLRRATRRYNKRAVPARAGSRIRRKDSNIS